MESKLYQVPNVNGIEAQLQVSPCNSFGADGWHIHDDEVTLAIDDIDQYDTDLVSGGCLLMHFTPSQCRELAKKLNVLADQCRPASEIDRKDPQLQKELAVAEANIRELWATGESRKKAQPQQEKPEVIDVRTNFDTDAVIVERSAWDKAASLYYEALKLAKKSIIEDEHLKAVCPF